MSFASRCRILLVISATVGVCAGCATTPPTTFYLLNPTVQSQAPKNAPPGPVIEVGPVTLPGYLDRPQIVTRLSATRLYLAEFHKWAEPLENGVARVLAENLAATLSCERVVFYPARRSVRVDYEVPVQIIRFDAGEDGSVVLEATWRVTDNAGGVVAPQKRSRFEGSAEELTYDAITNEMSKLLGKLSEEISAAITARG